MFPLFVWGAFVEALQLVGQLERARLQQQEFMDAIEREHQALVELHWLERKYREPNP